MPVTGGKISGVFTLLEVVLKNLWNLRRVENDVHLVNVTILTSLHSKSNQLINWECQEREYNSGFGVNKLSEGKGKSFADKGSRRFL